MATSYAMPDADQPPWLLRPTRLGITPAILILSAVVLLAALLRLLNFEAAGDGNLYYTAAVKSMLMSPSNFFFAAAEPGGSVSVDKPPLGLWIQCLSALVFGVNGFGVIFPQILAGLVSVVLLYFLVKRALGPIAGLLAALAQAVTPASVAVERSNTMDALLVLVLLLAAWAFIKASESGRLRHLLVGAALVGVGFNIKMLGAFLPLPAFYALYLACGPGALRRKIGSLALATLVLAVVSFAWIAVVDLTPPASRPYVGSSQTNSAFELAFGYNGLSRLFGSMRPGGAPAGLPNPPQGAPVPPSGAPGLPALGRGPFNGAGFGPGQDAGTPGLLRIFTPPLSKEASWTIPFALLGLGLAAWRWNRKFPLDSSSRFALLWGGWLLTGLLIFTFAGFMHAYYLSLIAPPLAAVMALALVHLWRLSHDRPRLSEILLAAGVLVTLLIQFNMMWSYGVNVLIVVVPFAFLVTGILLWLSITGLHLGEEGQNGLALPVGALLVIPLAWSFLTTYDARFNPALPEAYNGPTSGRFARPINRPVPPGGAPAGEISLARQEVIEYLQERTAGMKYLLAAPSALTGDPFVMATGRPVLFMGGFTGQDPVATPQILADLVRQGQLRFILSGREGPQGSRDVQAWVQQNCAPDPSVDLPDLAPGPSRGFTLYDCQK